MRYARVPFSVKATAIRRGARVAVRVRRVANAPLAEPHNLSMTVSMWPSAVFGPDVMELRADAPVPRCVVAGPSALAPKLDVQVCADGPTPFAMVGYMVDERTFVGTFCGMAAHACMLT